MPNAPIEVNERNFDQQRAAIATEMLGEAAEWFSIQIDDGVATITIHGEINIGVSWEKLVDQLELAGAKEIRLVIRDCPGGDSQIAAMFFKFFNGKISETVIYGRCYSAALPFALCGLNIRMEKSARLLLHSPVSFCYGESIDLAVTSRQLERLQKGLAAILMQRTELPVTVVMGWLNGADVYFSADTALAYGLVDSVFTAPKLPIGPAPTVTVNASTPEIKMPTWTDDEKLVSDLLFALGRVRVTNRQNFVREVSAWAAINSDQV